MINHTDIKWYRKKETIATAAMMLVALIGLGYAAIAHFSRETPEYASTYTPVPAEPLPVAPTLSIPDNPRVLFIGDSLTDGSAASNKAALGFAPRLASMEGWSDYRVKGVALSGFLAPGISEEAHRNYRDRLQEIFFANAYSPNVIIFQGGTADMNYSPSEVQAKVVETVKVAQKYWPGVQIAVIGPIATSTQLSAVNGAYMRAAYEVKIPYIDALQTPFIPPNERATLISEDGWHPNDAGHQLIAEKLKLKIQELTR